MQFRLIYLDEYLYLLALEKVHKEDDYKDIVICSTNISLITSWICDKYNVSNKEVLDKLRSIINSIRKDNSVQNKINLIKQLNRWLDNLEIKEV